MIQITSPNVLFSKINLFLRLEIISTYSFNKGKRVLAQWRLIWGWQVFFEHGANLFEYFRFRVVPLMMRIKRKAQLLEICLTSNILTMLFLHGHIRIEMIQITIDRPFHTLSILLIVLNWIPFLLHLIPVDFDDGFIFTDLVLLDFSGHLDLMLFLVNRKGISHWLMFERKQFCLRLGFELDEAFVSAMRNST